MGLLSHAWQFRWEEITVALTGTMAPWQHLKDGISAFSLPCCPSSIISQSRGCPELLLEHRSILPF